jgi:hypothetical protein
MPCPVFADPKTDFAFKRIFERPRGLGDRMGRDHPRVELRAWGCEWLGRVAIMTSS